MPGRRNAARTAGSCDAPGRGDTGYGTVATVVAPLLALAGFASYFLVSTRFAIYRRYPWEFIAVVAFGAALGLHRAVASPGAGTAVAAILAAGILALACWYFFAFSMFGTREDRPRVGERFPDFTLPTSDGSVFHLAAAGGRRHLILFYRGGW